MKVGYVAPMSIAAINGGLRTQALQTIEHIRNFGVKPVLISPWDENDVGSLDLVHVFGASIENIGIVDHLYTQQIPFLLSPVFFSNRSAAVIKRFLKIEKLSTAFSHAVRSDLSIKADLSHKANLILPNTKEEAQLIQEGFSVSSKKIQVVPNGVEAFFAEANPDLFIEEYGLKDFVLFVGQAGAERKNVIKLLEIAPKIDSEIVIIGSFYENKYSKKCMSLAKIAENVTLIETLEHQSKMLASAYAASKVFVLPSQYETPGIAAMEAALTGSQIVITEKGGTKDYFSGFAEFITPESSTSLLEGIQKALVKKKSTELKEHILANYSWYKVAELTSNQYKKVLA
jgi:glycosyltransferase involved in cell wall biosynthesis